MAFKDLKKFSFLIYKKNGSCPKSDVPLGQRAKMGKWSFPKGKKNNSIRRSLKIN